MLGWPPIRTVPLFFRGPSLSLPPKRHEQLALGTQGHSALLRVRDGQLSRLGTVAEIRRLPGIGSDLPGDVGRMSVRGRATRT